MMTKLYFHKPERNVENQTELNNEINLSRPSISLNLTNDTLFIQADFLLKEFNDFFAKRQ